MVRLIAWSSRSAALLVLSAALVSGCAGTTTVLTPTPTRATVEETFISTEIAVIVPAPAHPGDSITVVVKPNPVYQPDNPQYNIQFTSWLYGPFPSLASEQSAIATSTVGPPSWPNRISGPSGGGTVGGPSGGVDLVTQSTITLPTTLALGYYDIAVTLTLTGSRATARSDTVVQVVARS